MEAEKQIEWLREKLADAEKALRARNQAKETWQDGSEADWKAAAKMHGGKVLSKSARTKLAEREGRIAKSYLRDVEMLTELIRSISEKSETFTEAFGDC